MAISLPSNDEKDDLGLVPAPDDLGLVPAQDDLGLVSMEPQAPLPKADGPSLYSAEGRPPAFWNATTPEQKAIERSVELQRKAQEFSALDMETRAQLNTQRLFRENLTAQAVNLPAKLLNETIKAQGGPSDLVPQLIKDAHPLEEVAGFSKEGQSFPVSIASKGAGLVTELATSIALDPLGNAAFNKATNVLAKRLDATKTFGALGTLLKNRETNRVLMEEMGDYAEREFLKSSRNYMARRVAKFALERGGAGAGTAALQDVVAQASDRNSDWDFERTFYRTLWGGGLAGLFGAAQGRFTVDPSVPVARESALDARGMARNAEARQPNESINAAIKSQSDKLGTKISKYKDATDTRLKTLKEEQVTKAQGRTGELQTKLTDLEASKAKLRPTDEQLAKESASELRIKAATETLDSRSKSLLTKKTQLESEKARITSPSNLVKGPKGFAREAVIDQQLKNVDKQLAALEKRKQDLVLKADKRATRSEVAYHIEARRIDAEIEKATKELSLAQKQQESPYVSVSGSDGARIDARRTRVAALERRIYDAQVAKNQLTKDHIAYYQNQAPITTKGRINGKYQTKQKYVEDTADFVDARVNKLVEEGIISPQHATPLKQNLFTEALEKRNVPTNKGKVSAPGEIVRNFLMNRTEGLAKLDRLMGTRTMEVFSKALRLKNLKEHHNLEAEGLARPIIESLEAKGMLREDVTELLHYVISDKNGLSIFDGRERTTKGNIISAYDGSYGPASQVLERFPELRALRDLYDQSYNSLPVHLREGTGYLPGYVPQMPKDTGGAGRGASKQTAPGVLKPRKVGEWNPAHHETDPVKLFASWHAKVRQGSLVKEISDDVLKEVHKMELLGKSGVDRDYFLNAMSDALGFKDRNILESMVVEQQMHKNDAVFKSILTANDIPIDKQSEFLSVMRSLMFNAKVLRPKNLIEQDLQLPFVGGVEIGQRNVLKGLQLAADPKNAEMNKRIDKELMSVDIGIQEEIGRGAIKSKAGKLVAKAGDKVSNIFRFKNFFNNKEIRNRRAIFWGAHYRFQKAYEKGGLDAIDEICDGMLIAERDAIARELSENGLSAAAHKYGIIKSTRTNFWFSVANKPEALTRGMGSYIPFTSWRLNNLNRYFQELNFTSDEFNPRKAALRFGIPVVAMGIFRMLTGYDMPGSDTPEDEVLSALHQFSPAPALTGPIAKIAEARHFGKNPVTAGLKEFGKNIPGVSNAIEYSDIAKSTPKSKRLKEYLLKRAGLKKDKERNPTKRLIPPWMRK